MKEQRRTRQKLKMMRAPNELEYILRRTRDLRKAIKDSERTED